MGRKFGSIGRLGSIGVIALIGFAVGSIPATAGSDISRPRTIHLVAITTEQNALDLGASGFSQGDEFIFHDDEVKVRAVSLVLTAIDQQGERHGVVSRIARPDLEGQVLDPSRAAVALGRCLHRDDVRRLLHRYANLLREVWRIART